MDPLVRATYFLRRVVRRGLPLVFALGLGALVVLDANGPLPLAWALPAAGLYLLLLAWRGLSRLRGSAPDLLAEIELGLLSTVGVYALMQRSEGGLTGALSPLVYVLVALVSAFARPFATGAVVAFAISLEGTIRYLVLGERDPFILGSRAAFIVVFALFNLVFLRAEIARIRARFTARIDAEIAKMREAARSYRLLGAPSKEASSHQSDEERLLRSSVEEIHQAVLFALDLLRRSLKLHTALLVWLNDAQSHARISELSSESDQLADGPFLAGDGLIGAVVARKAIVALEGLRPGYKLPYYVGPCPVASACGVPVMEHGQLRGVLIVDRIENRPFAEEEDELLLAAARYIVRAIQNERVFMQLERAKVEQGKLYRAVDALSEATGEAEVVEAAVASAREMALFDFAAVTLYDDRSRTHEIRAVSADGSDRLLGARFRHNTGLVAMVVQNRHPLPYKGDFDADRQVVFTKRLKPPAMPSLLVLPLLVQNRPLGTLVLGAKRRGAFGDSVRPTLEVLASHMAVSLANARMVRKLEEMATTDGLTGLFNKRALLEAVEQKLLSATRFKRKLSVLVADIDFFKKVNDNYGHDIGDIVIKGLADILRNARRATDIVARFGGEEFVIVCEETDSDGAMLLAERIRTELETTSFQTPHGPIQVTCSIGIATFPEAGRGWEELFKAADEALYESKRSGRNRCTIWGPKKKTAA